MGGKTPHSMKSHGPTNDRTVFFSPCIGPRNREGERLIEGGLPNFFGQLNNSRCRNSSDRRRPIWRGIFNLTTQQLKCWRHPLSLMGPRSHNVLTLKGWHYSFGVAWLSSICVGIPNVFIVRKVGINLLRARIK